MPGTPRRGASLLFAVVLVVLLPLSFLAAAGFCQLRCCTSFAEAMAGAGLYGVVALAWTIGHGRWCRRSGRRIVASSLGVTLWAVIVLASTVGSGPLERGRQKRTLSDIRALGIAIESYHVDEERYPELAGIEEAAACLSPTYIKQAPRIDGWMYALDVRSTAGSYTVISHGMCGKPDVSSPADYAPGPTDRWDADIVWRDGEFFRYPAAAR